MKKFLFLALVLMSAKLLAIELPKDTLWVGYVPYIINNVMFSRDESKVYVNTTIGFSILDAKTGNTIEEVKGLGNIGKESADGSYFMNVHPTDIRIKEGNIEKYDSKTRQLIWRCPKREKDDLRTAAFSENGKYILLIYTGNSLDIYNTETQELVKTVTYNKFAFDERGFAIDNTGEKIIVSIPITVNGKGGTASYLIDLKDSDNLKQIYFHQGYSQNKSAMFSSKNNFALPRYEDTLTVFNLNTMKSFDYIPSGGNYGSRVGIMSPDEKLLISGGVKEGWIELYDIQNKKIVYTAGENNIGETESSNINKTNEVLLFVLLNKIISFDVKKSWTDVIIDNINQITISPNPSNNKIRVANPSNLLIMDVSAINLTGNLFPLQIIENEINISHLTIGKYFLRITLADNKVLNFNFIKE